MQPFEQSKRMSANVVENDGQDDSDRQNESGFRQVVATVADKMYGAADSLRRQATRGQQETELTRFGERAANWMQRSADYVNDLEAQKLRNDFENQVRRNPGRSLLIAGAVGLVLGGILRRR